MPQGISAVRSTNGLYLYLLFTAWSRILLEKLTGSQLVKKFPALYGTRMFFTPFTSATCPYPESARSNPYPHVPLPEIHLNIVLPSTLGSPKWSFSLWFPHQNPVYTSPPPTLPTWSSHLILLDFMTTKVFGENYRSLSSSLYSFLHSPVISSLLYPYNVVSSASYSQTPPPSMWATNQTIRFMRISPDTTMY